MIALSVRIDRSLRVLCQRFKYIPELVANVGGVPPPLEVPVP